MKNIARLDENGVLISVETVSEVDWKTDPATRTVKLPQNHDMDLRLRSYWYDFVGGRFEPLMVLDRTGEGAIEFGDAVVEAILLVAKQVNCELPSKLRKALGTRPGKK